jgi:hypothetical protein
VKLTSKGSVPLKISPSYLFALGVTLLGSDAAQAQSTRAAAGKAAGKNCITISGTISGTVTSAPGASQTTILGTVVGSLQGSVHATVTSLEPQPDGTVRLKLSHDFVTDEGFLLQTTDTAKLTPVPGLKNVFQQTTEYEIKAGTGRFAAAKGKFTNHGETDLGRGLLTLRYDGRICGVAR